VLRIIATIGAATAVASVIIVLSGFAPAVDASPKPAAIKGDRLDIHLLGTACSGRGWPYFEFGCMYDRTARDGQVRAVRVIQVDRLPANIQADIETATSGTANRESHSLIR